MRTGFRHINKPSFRVTNPGGVGKFYNTPQLLRRRCTKTKLVILNGVKDLSVMRTKSYNANIYNNFFSVRNFQILFHTYMKKYFTYIITNRKYGSLYTGMTNDVMSRTRRHSNMKEKSFSGKHKLNKLVWFESFNTPGEAIQREKEIKGWLRSKKIELIEKNNPDWKDLCHELSIEMGKKYQPISKVWPYQRPNKSS